MTSSSALEAGRNAAAAMRWAEAYEQLATASALGALEGTDLELLAEVALLRGEQGDAVAQMTRAYEAHLAAGSSSGGARAAGWLALWLIEIGDFTQCATWAARATHLVRDIDDPGSLAGFVRLPAAVAQLGSGDPAEARRMATEILELGEREGDRDLVAYAALCLGTSLVQLGEPAQALRCFDRAMAAIAAGEVGVVAAGVVACAVVSEAIMASDLDRATAWAATLDLWCRRQPELLTFTGQRHALLAALLIARGAWPEADTAVELALTRFRAGDFRAAHGAPYHHAELARLRGAFRSAEVSYAKAAESGWEPQPGLALLRLATGRVQQAQEEIRRSAAGADPFTRLFLLPAVVEIEVAAGDLGAARRAADALRSSGTRLSTPTLDALLAAAEARILLSDGDPTAALEQARAAASSWTRLGCTYEQARCTVLAARAQLVLGDRTAAEVDLAAARTAFLGLGADPALAEVDALRRTTGDRSPGRLTAREVEVLRLVSTGLTNRAIGERLSLSEKTVARHLSNIFGKLELSSRAGATAWAYENGLV